MEKNSIKKRRQELIDYIGNEEIYGNLIDEMVFLEEHLKALRKLPMIRVNPKNKAQQRTTIAQKQYKEFLQQYTNVIKTLTKSLKNEENDESPLRRYLEELTNAH